LIFKHIAIAADHAGHELKQILQTYLNSQHTYITKDLGTANAHTSVDYPDYAQAVAEQVSAGKIDAGIIICGTGLGVSIVANKFPKVRAICPWDQHSCKMGREHNDANILCLGARTLAAQKALDITITWLSTEFTKERHQKRLNKIKAIEQSLQLGQHR
jgi:ribose 5-phosphate isomerase B